MTTATAAERNEIYQKLTPIFHDVFDDTSITLRDSLTAKEVAQWDSLNHINLIVAVEQFFKIKFKTAEIAALANVGDFADAISRKLKASH